MTTVFLKDLEKNHQYYEKNTRRFFQSNGEIVIADGKIVGYGSDEESNSRLYHNVHADGDEEDLSLEDAKRAVEAFAKKDEVHKPQKILKRKKISVKSGNMNDCLETDQAK